MSKPLITKKEQNAHNKKLAGIDKSHGYENRKLGNNFNWDSYWAEKKATEDAWAAFTVRKAQARPDEFINALLILVGERGTQYIHFEAAFAGSDNREITAMVLKHDTAESRRILYTLLRALTEIPKSWAMSAYVRFLRGTGKQAKAKYHGAGMLSSDYGWKGQEVQAIANIIAGSHYATGYSTTLMSYADVDQEIRDEDPDFEVVDYDATHKATRAERDIEFIDALCENLEARGLAPVPRPTRKVLAKKRKPRMFKSGDRVRNATVRDLPLPAHVRIPIMRREKKDKTDTWVEADIEFVVLKLYQGGYDYARVGGGTAYRHPRGYHLMNHKEWLHNATYLGPWTGKIEKQNMEYKFWIRQRDK
jgi:hypothetical protein